MSLKHLLLLVETLQSCCSLCHSKFKCRIARSSNFPKESNIINSYINFLFLGIWQLIKFIFKTYKPHVCMSHIGPQDTTVGFQITHATYESPSFQKYSTLLPCPMCFLPIAAFPSICQIIASFTESRMCVECELRMLYYLIHPIQGSAELWS